MANTLLRLYTRKQSTNSAVNTTVRILCSMKLHVSVLKPHQQGKYEEIFTSNKMKCKTIYI
jgi:hypothetical protein